MQERSRSRTASGSLTGVFRRGFAATASAPAVVAVAFDAADVFADLVYKKMTFSMCSRTVSQPISSK